VSSESGGRGRYINEGLRARVRRSAGAGTNSVLPLCSAIAQIFGSGRRIIFKELQARGTRTSDGPIGAAGSAVAANPRRSLVRSQSTIEPASWPDRRARLRASQSAWNSLSRTGLTDTGVRSVVATYKASA
jgi:hypothetical protein